MENGEPISYLALKVGTSVLSSEGNVFGTVEHVLQDAELDLFDGIALATHHGLRFVSRDQIIEITTTAVRCALTDEQATQLPKPDGPSVFHVDGLQDVGPSLSARLGRMFRREHWTADN